MYKESIKDSVKELYTIFKKKNIRIKLKKEKYMNNNKEFVLVRKNKGKRTFNVVYRHIPTGRIFIGKSNRSMKYAFLSAERKKNNWEERGAPILVFK